MNRTTASGLQVENQETDGMMTGAPETDSAPQTPLSVNNASYSLSEELLATYHRLLDKKFSEGLTAAEEAELDRVSSQLDEADRADPLEQDNAFKVNEEHCRRLAALDQVITLLKSLRSEA